MYRYGIVVIGYKRINSLKRILHGVGRAEYENYSITLIISLDYSGNDEIYKLADDFDWIHGRKIVIKHSKSLGLREHVFKCGNFLNDYNLDALIVLEDDVYPAVDFFLFSCQATQKYISNEIIAGISLYSPSALEMNGKPFCPIHAPYDTFFMHTAVSWGQIWFRRQWNDFYEWYIDNREWDNNYARIPSNVVKWPDSSWKKYHIKYCVEKNKYFVFPYLSRTTCFADAGVHTFSNTDKFQVALSGIPKNKLEFPDFNDKAIIYDAFYENTGLFKACGYEEYELEINLNCTKERTNKRYLIIPQVMDYHIIKSWGNKLIPQELNVIYDVWGEGIFLYDLGTNHKETCLPTVEYNKSKYEKYFQLMYYWMDLRNKGIRIADYLNNRNWTTIGIYGWGNIGKLLFDELCSSNIEVKCIIDNNSKEKGVINSQQLIDNRHLYDVDRIIVTPYLDLESIKDSLKGFFNDDIISIESILDEMR